jgi:hypothetical protein
MLYSPSRTVCSIPISSQPLLDDSLTFADWDTGSAAIETAQGKAVADASVTAGVTLLIWSSLPNVTEMTKGKITTVHHFDSKAEVERYIRTLPIVSAFFMAGWYMQNHIFWTPPKMVRLLHLISSMMLVLIGSYSRKMALQCSRKLGFPMVCSYLPSFLHPKVLRSCSDTMRELRT